MGAVSGATFAALRRRRLRSLAIAAVLFLATGAATIALDTLVESDAPFDHAFAAANGAHLVIDFDVQVSAEQLAATTHAGSVTASAGPWLVGPIGLLLNQADVGKVGSSDFGLVEASARPQPDTAIDRMTISSGRWWQARGEVVLSQGRAEQFGKSVGDTIQVQQAPPAITGSKGAASAPIPGPAAAQLPVKTLTIVGIAGSISTPYVAVWMSPAELAALSPGPLTSQQMFYRVASAGTPEQLAAAATEITAGLRSNAVLGTQTYLAERESVDRTASIMVPILLAFSGFSLLAAAFIIVNVVSGIVLASYRDIGLMKALGYTPGQVTATLLGEICAPAVVGSVVGVALGTLVSQPIVRQTARAFGLPNAFALSAPVIAGVLVAAVGAALLAALGPATRAGGLSPVEAMTRGAAPSLRAGGGTLRRAALALPVVDPIRLGLAAGLARPLRAAMMLGALVVGVGALVFALGLDASLRQVGQDLIRDHASPVRAEVRGGGTAPDAITAAFAANPDTARMVAIGQDDVTVAKVGSIPFVGYQGDSGWIGYALIHGRWFTDPGEVVAPTNFFTRTGLHVGDEVAATLNGRSANLMLVGEIFDQARENREDLVLRGELSDLAALDPSIQPSRWELQPRPGVLPLDYRSALRDVTSFGQSLDIQAVEDSSTNSGFLLFEGVVAILGAALVVISLGGVVNTVLLETRERSREIAILKAVGMTPAQVLRMIVASIVPIGILAGLVGVPLGLTLQRLVLQLMGQAAAATAIPARELDVLAPAVLLVLAMCGLVIGAFGALPPAIRAARSPIAPVLQAE